MSTTFTTLAQSLPYDILYRIFIEAVKSTTAQWGGLLFGWRSNEFISRLVTVCRNWSNPANHVLYKSIALLSHSAARSFVKTSKSRPDLIKKTRYLVIGLSEEDTWTSSEEDEELVDIGGGKLEIKLSIGKATRGTQPATSSAMLRALEICINLQHLQIRPLHDSQRLPLFAALAEKLSLESLICSPRLRNRQVDWTGCIFRRDDLRNLALPTLKHLEIDAWTAVDLPVLDKPRIIIPLLSKLITLRLRFDTCDEDLFDLLSTAGPTLELADIYVERLVDPSEAAEALSSSVSTLRELRWTTNPSIESSTEVIGTALFDRILPQFQVLEKAALTATDISASLFTFLPSSLRELEVRSLSYLGPFKYHESMLRTLGSTSTIQFSLKKFVVYDSRDVWSNENVTALTGACLQRVSLYNSTTPRLLN